MYTFSYRNLIHQFRNSFVTNNLMVISPYSNLAIDQSPMYEGFYILNTLNKDEKISDLYKNEYIRIPWYAGSFSGNCVINESSTLTVIGMNNKTEAPVNGANILQIYRTNVEKRDVFYIYAIDNEFFQKCNLNLKEETVYFPADGLTFINEDTICTRAMVKLSDGLLPIIMVIKLNLIEPELIHISIPQIKDPEHLKYFGNRIMNLSNNIVAIGALKLYKEFSEIYILKCETELSIKDNTPNINFNKEAKKIVDFILC